MTMMGVDMVTFASNTPSAYSARKVTSNSPTVIVPVTSNSKLYTVFIEPSSASEVSPFAEAGVVDGGDLASGAYTRSL